MSGILIDLRHVLRGLGASRAFTLVAVASLTIGIGANAAIFSVIRTLLLDDLVAPAPAQLSLFYWHQPGTVQISQMNSSGGSDTATGLSLRSNVSYPLYRSLVEATPKGVDVFGFNFLFDMNLSFVDRPAATAGGMAADGGYFRVLAPPMALGRGIRDEDDRDDAAPVAVLSHGLFMRVFGGDTTVIGRTIRVNGVPAEIIGVTAREFRGLSKGGFFPQTEITVPLRLVPRLQPGWASDRSLLASDQHYWVRLMARIPDDRQKAAVSERWAGVLGPVVAQRITEKAGETRVLLQPGRRGLDQTRPETRSLLYVLMGVVGVVLLIACVNLAGLMLARGAARAREIGLRRALGAGRWRLMRAQLLEGLVLALAGSAGGLLLTFLARRVLTNLLTAGLGTAPMSRQPLEVSVDAALIAATVAVGCIVAVLFSLLPALRFTRGDTVADVKHQVAGAPTPKLTIGRALVALQIAVTVPLLVCAALFLRTVANLGAVDLGFDPAGIAYFRINPASVEKELAGQSAMYQRVLDRLRVVPGVSSVTLVENALLSGIVSNTRQTVNGVDHQIYVNAVGPDFLDTMGLRLLAGRMPGVQDGPGRPAVAVVNQRAAKQMFGDASPLGQSLKFSFGPMEIVGVVSDAKYDRQRSDVRPTLYPSALQRQGFGGHHVVIRSGLDAARLEPLVRAAVADVSRELAVPAIRTQAGNLREMTMRERVFAQLLTLFGGFALLLACIGLHGVTSYAVSRRTREIGVRMAVGAAPGQVLWLILRQVGVLAVAGLVIGIPIALWAAPLFGTLLFGVTPTDTGTLVSGAVIMVAVALIAGWLPARRAARLDPLKALRTE